jgi:hypothetical protein
MSAPFEVDVTQTFNRYVRNPLKQLNLGWTITSFWFIAAVAIGLLLIALAFIVTNVQEDYRNGTKSKNPFIILMYIGIALVLFGLFATISNFYRVVKDINTSVRNKGACSFFTTESPKNAARLVASEVTFDKNVNDLIAIEADKASKLLSRPGAAYGEEAQYLRPDARETSLYDLLIEGKSSPKTPGTVLEEKKKNVVEGLKALYNKYVSETRNQTTFLTSDQQQAALKGAEETKDLLKDLGVTI